MYGVGGAVLVFRGKESYGGSVYSVGFHRCFLTSQGKCA